MGTRTASANFIIIAECEACNNILHWKDQISHQTSSSLILGLIKDPIPGLIHKIGETDLSKKAIRACSKCGYIQSYMHSRWRKMYRVNWYWPVALALLGLFNIFLVFYFPNEGWPTSRLVQAAFGGIIALCALPAGIFIAKNLDSGPNRKWHKKHGTKIPAKNGVRIEPTSYGMTVCPSCRQQTKGKQNPALYPTIILFCLLPILGIWLWGPESVVPMMILAVGGCFFALKAIRQMKLFWPSVICEHCKNTWQDDNFI